MSQPFHQPGPDRLELREGGGCLSLFGLPFFMAGLFMILIAIRVVPIENADEVGAGGLAMAGLMGLAFVAVGGGLVFGRRWTVFERGRAIITRETGLLVPMKREELSLADFAAVALRFDKGDSDSVDRHPVVLKARSAGQDLALYSWTNYGEARAAAAQLAGFLSLPLEDATTPNAAVLAPEQVNATLQERLREGSDRYEPVAQPLQMRSQVEDLGGEVRITIPGPGFSPLLLLQLVIPAGIALFFVPSLLDFFRQTGTPGYVQNGFVGFIMIGFVLFPLLGFAGTVVGSFRRRTRVTVTPGELVVEEREAWRTRATRIPAGEIMGLDSITVQAGLDTARRIAAQRAGQPGGLSQLIPGGEATTPWWMTALSKLGKSRGITVKARGGLTTFGAGLPDAEVDYLHALVKRTLAG